MSGDEPTGAVMASEVVGIAAQRTLWPIRAVLVWLMQPDGTEQAFALPPELALSLAKMLREHGTIAFRKRQADRQ